MFVRRTGSVLGKGFLGRVPEVLCMELGIGLEPLLRWAILMLLKVRDEIIEDIGEVVFKTIIADETLSPDEEAGTSLGDEGNSDRGVNEPRGKEGIQFVESILELRSCVEKLGFAAI